MHDEHTEKEAARLFAEAMREEEKAEGPQGCFFLDGKYGFKAGWSKDAAMYFQEIRQLCRAREAHAVVVVPHCALCGAIALGAAMRHNVLGFGLGIPFRGEPWPLLYLALPLRISILDVLVGLHAVGADHGLTTADLEKARAPDGALEYLFVPSWSGSVEQLRELAGCVADGLAVIEALEGT
jgi:hypothetical protein